jgi:hypothetical protein
MDLRKFKDENPEYFRTIKNMPLRARVCRRERTKKDTSICFIRNNRRDAFYWVHPDLTLEEMTFVEVAREFRADVPEKGIEMHPEHHNHVNAALEDFHTKLQEEISSGQVVDTTQGPNEKKALSYLDGFFKPPIYWLSRKR